MIDTAALRSKIIDLAIQGKLTEQLPTDGNAEDLYQQIQAEKAQLIKEKKIKKEKPLPEITADEIPFDVPDNWKWVRLRDIGYLTSGNQYTEVEVGIPYIKVSDLNLLDNQVEIITYSRFVGVDNTGLIPTCSIIFPKRGGAIATNKKRIVKRYPIYVDSNIMSLTVINKAMLYYIRLWFDSIDLMKLQSGTSIPQINNKDLYPLLIPLPPLSEQKRIVAKIDEVLAEIKIIDELQSQYASNVDALKSKIIDAGIRGQLTEQLPEDGTAEELYQAIQTEKAQLIKDKKIKKEKPLPEITADEIPFDVPDNWKWVRISDVVKYSLGGGTPSKNISEYWKGGDIPWASVKDFSAAEAGHLNDTIDHITQDGLNNSASNMVDENAIVICMRMALGKAVRFLRPMAINQDLRAIWLHDCVDQSYFMYMYSTIKVEGRGTTVAGIRKDELMSFLFPLPPLSEQKRIVAKINDVFGALDERDRL